MEITVEGVVAVSPEFGVEVRVIGVGTGGIGVGKGPSRTVGLVVTLMFMHLAVLSTHEQFDLYGDEQSKQLPSWYCCTMLQLQVRPNHNHNAYPSHKSYHFAGLTA